MNPLTLNANAVAICETLVAQSDRFRIDCSVSANLPDGARLIDCGAIASGGLEAGRRLAEVCMAGLGRVSFGRCETDVWRGAAVHVETDFPVAACLASQYAGWELKTEGFFAMGSGPMRAAAGREVLFDAIGFRESAAECVGVLESSTAPPDEACAMIAEKCGVPTKKLTLLYAPTRSIAGAVQIVARSIETTMHKLHELDFDCSRIESAHGAAPLPPPCPDDISAIGRTNDAILYGASVTLYARGDDASLREVGQKTPSCASPDHGRPFAQIFAEYNHDFYQVDPHLFSPAVVTISNLDSGNSFRFGHTLPRVIHESFGVA